jgi:hypothetical protein
MDARFMAEGIETHDRGMGRMKIPEHLSTSLRGVELL